MKYSPKSSESAPMIDGGPFTADSIDLSSSWWKSYRSDPVFDAESDNHITLYVARYFIHAVLRATCWLCIRKGPLFLAEQNPEETQYNVVHSIQSCQLYVPFGVASFAKTDHISTPQISEVVSLLFFSFFSVACVADTSPRFIPTTFTLIDEVRSQASA